MGSQLQEAEARAYTASKSTDGLESQLAEVSANLVEQLVEGEARIKSLEKNLTQSSGQLADARRKAGGGGRAGQEK